MNDPDPDNENVPVEKPKESPIALTGDPGKDIMALFVFELQRRLIQRAAEMTSSELEVVRKLLGDNSVTLASIRRGDFGDIAKKVAEDFPFPEGTDAAAPIGTPVN